MDKDNNVYQWVVKSPVHEVCLKQETYDDHITDENTRTPEEIQHLIDVGEDVKMIVQNPRFIYKDNNYEENLRHRYVDFIYHDKFSHLQALVVVVDTDRDPHEVVTWTIKRSLNQEKGGVIYDSRKDK